MNFRVVGNPFMVHSTCNMQIFQKKKQPSSSDKRGGLQFLLPAGGVAGT